jgi:hypothetical protein
MLLHTHILIRKILIFFLITNEEGLIHKKMQINNLELPGGIVN